MSAADRTAFLAAIRENPDDDLPRLVYADWLDEHGEPERAEFIRVQCELAKLQQGEHRWKELRSRERKLLRAREAEWRAALPNLPNVGIGPFDRGFPGAVIAGSFREFMSIADRLFEALPVDSLVIHGIGSRELRSLIRSCPLTSLTGLDLSGG